MAKTIELRKRTEGEIKAYFEGFQAGYRFVRCQVERSLQESVATVDQIVQTNQDVNTGVKDG